MTNVPWNACGARKQNAGQSDPCASLMPQYSRNIKIIMSDKICHLRETKEFKDHNYIFCSAFDSKRNNQTDGQEQWQELSEKNGACRVTTISRSNFKVKVIKSRLWYHVKGLVTIKEYKCELWKPDLLWFESYGQCKVKVFIHSANAVALGLFIQAH